MDGSIEYGAYKSELMEKFRLELPVLRAKARISQEELSAKVGISRQTYSGIETGRREMTWTVFLALWSFFQLNLSTKDLLESAYDFSNDISKIVNYTKDSTETIF